MASGSGTAPPIGDHLGRVGAPGDVGRDGWRRRARPPCRRWRPRRWAACASRPTAASQSSPCGRVVAVLRGRRTWSRRARPDRPGPRPRCDMLHSVMRPSIDKAADGRSPVLDDVADAAAGADGADDGQRHVLGRDARRQVALDRDGHGLRAHLRQRLGGQHVLDLAGADAEGERAEGAVGRGVAVAADDRHAGLGPALLGTDDVDDALVGVAHRVAGDAELGAVVVEHLRAAGPRSGRPPACRCRWSGTLWSAVATVRSGRRTVAPGQPQPVEGLGRGDLVDQVQVDEEEVRLALGRVDDVGVPDLLAERARSAHQRPPPRCATWSMPPGALYSTASPALLPDEDLARGASWARRRAGRPGAPRWSRRRTAGCRPRRHLRSGGSPCCPCATTAVARARSRRRISTFLSRAWSWRIRDSIFPWESLAAW